MKLSGKALIVIAILFCTGCLLPAYAGELDDNLLKQSEAGNQQEIRKLLEQGAQVDASNPKGSTALMLAANNGHLQAVKLLLSKGADVNAANENGSTALMVASYKGKLEIAKLLLSKGASVYAGTDGGVTALSAAKEANHKDVVKVLELYGARRAETEPEGQLIAEASAGNAEQVKKLLDSGVSPNISDPQGWTPIIHAAGRGQIGVVQLLLDRGAEVNARTGSGRYSPHGRQLRWPPRRGCAAPIERCRRQCQRSG